MIEEGAFDMKKIFSVIIVTMLLVCCLSAQSKKTTSNYKSAVSFSETKTSDNRYEIIVESKGQVRYMLFKNYQDAFDTYYAFALFAKENMDTNLVDMVPSVVNKFKSQGHKIKIIDDSNRGGYHGIAYNID